MKKYNVSIRKVVADWEIPSDIWDSDFYNDDYIEAEDAGEAVEIIRNYIAECQGDPEAFDYRADEV